MTWRDELDRLDPGGRTTWRNELDRLDPGTRRRKLRAGRKSRAEDKPRAEQAPSVEKAPHAEDTPSVEKAPHAEDTPSVEKAPHAEDTHLAEQESPPERKPQAPRKPRASDKPRRELRLPDRAANRLRAAGSRVAGTTTLLGRGATRGMRAAAAGTGHRFRALPTAIAGAARAIVGRSRDGARRVRTTAGRVRTTARRVRTTARRVRTTAGPSRNGARRLPPVLTSRWSRVVAGSVAAVALLAGGGYLAAPLASGMLPDRQRMVDLGSGTEAAHSPRLDGDELVPGPEADGLAPDEAAHAGGDPGLTATEDGSEQSSAGGGSDGSSGSNGSNGSSGDGPVSLGFYPGWVRYGPDDVDYSPWSRIAHFGVYPREDGTLRFSDLSRSDLAPAVRAAHANNTEIVLAIGGEGTRDGFMGATRDANRAGFVREIVSVATEHGYDGISIDWADQVDSGRFTALLRDLRAEMDARAPGLMIGFAAVSGLLSPSLAADVHHLADYVEIMSYQNDGTTQLDRYLDAGVPASKLLVGMGFSSNWHDTSPDRVQGKIDLAEARGAAGVSVWSFQHLNGDFSDPRLEPLRAYTSGG